MESDKEIVEAAKEALDYTTANTPKEYNSFLIEANLGFAWAKARFEFENSLESERMSFRISSGAFNN